jgi:hypothetical protein
VPIHDSSILCILGRELLWGTNRETWRDAFFSRDLLFLYAIRSQKRMRRSYPAALPSRTGVPPVFAARTVAQPEYAHLTVVRLHSPRQAEELLALLRQGKVEEHKT